MGLKVEEPSFANILIGIVLIMLILIALVFSSYIFYRDHKLLVAAEHWMPVQAIIKNERVYVSDALLGKSGHPRQDCITVSTIYTFKDSSYEKNFLVDCQASSIESDIQVGQQLRQTYLINSKIGIRFNPQQPEQAMTATEFNSLSDRSIGNTLKAGLKTFGIAVISIACVVLSIVLFVIFGLLFGRWKKSPSIKRPQSIFDYEP